MRFLKHLFTRRPILKVRYQSESFQPKLGLAKPGDVGIDLPCYGGTHVLEPGHTANIPTGVSIKLPEGTWGLVTARSSTFYKKKLLVFPGIIDTGYTGLLFTVVHNLNSVPVIINEGQSIAQFIPLGKVAEDYDVRVVEHFQETSRGASGFGSSGDAGGVKE